MKYEEPATSADPDTAAMAELSAPTAEHTEVPAPTAEHTEAPAEPAESAGVRRSARVRTKPKDFIPSLAGKGYQIAALQYVDDEILHPDSQSFLMQC